MLVIGEDYEYSVDGEGYGWCSLNARTSLNWVWSEMPDGKLMVLGGVKFPKSITFSVLATALTEIVTLVNGGLPATANSFGVAYGAPASRQAASSLATRDAMRRSLRNYLKGQPKRGYDLIRRQRPIAFTAVMERRMLGIATSLSTMERFGATTGWRISSKLPRRSLACGRATLRCARS